MRHNVALLPATFGREREAAVALLPFLFLSVNYLTLLERLLTDAAERRFGCHVGNVGLGNLSMKARLR
jgi:hypothetical protein